MVTSGVNSPILRCARRVRALIGRGLMGLWLGGLLMLPTPSHATRLPQTAQAVLVAAQEAHRVGDRARLAQLRGAPSVQGHALTPWLDYWDLNLRLGSAQVEEVEAFYLRWSGTYVEDRLRNDWLLELGRRRDWRAFLRDQPRFKMNDDREVTCYGLWAQHLGGQEVHMAARAVWMAQRDPDDGCHQLASALVAAQRLGQADVWHKVRLAAEFNRPRTAKAAAALLGTRLERQVSEALERPAKVLDKALWPSTEDERQTMLVALIRLAASDPEAAQRVVERPELQRWPLDQQALAWAGVAKQAALKLLPQASAGYRRAWDAIRQQSPQAVPSGWSDDALAWQVRSALRLPAQDSSRWSLVLWAIEAMSAGEQKESTWVYWRARALQAQAAPGAAGEAQRQSARDLLQSIASPLNFYGKLATEDLGQRLTLPLPAAALSAAERQLAAQHPGLSRGLMLIGWGLRSEGVREWNFHLRGMSDRELLAAAQLACDQQVWDRCINTSERTRQEIDMSQRFPTPLREAVNQAAREAGLEPAYVYGLIRQESRFILDARSHVGASGLMQLMPTTAKWTAKKVGIAWKPEYITDQATNLKIGTTYLKLVLDDFEGSAALAAAAYNAGPGRPRRWREGALMEASAWAEAIPFNETRDYVKKVLSNATVYAALMRPEVAPSLKSRLGATIGPRAAAAPQSNLELP